MDSANMRSTDGDHGDSTQWNGQKAMSTFTWRSDVAKGSMWRILQSDLWCCWLLRIARHSLFHRSLLQVPTLKMADANAPQPQQVLPYVAPAGMGDLTTETAQDWIGNHMNPTQVQLTHLLSHVFAELNQVLTICKLSDHQKYAILCQGVQAFPMSPCSELPSMISVVFLKDLTA